MVGGEFEKKKNLEFGGCACNFEIGGIEIGIVVIIGRCANNNHTLHLTYSSLHTIYLFIIILIFCCIILPSLTPHPPPFSNKKINTHYKIYIIYYIVGEMREFD